MFETITNVSLRSTRDHLVQENNLTYPAQQGIQAVYLPSCYPSQNGYEGRLLLMRDDVGIARTLSSRPEIVFRKLPGNWLVRLVGQWYGLFLTR